MKCRICKVEMFQLSENRYYCKKCQLEYVRTWRGLTGVDVLLITYPILVAIALVVLIWVFGMKVFT